MLLQKLFENLAKKAGVDINDDSFKAISEKLKDTEVSEEIATKIESNLYDVESAKQNYTLKQHFTALALNGVDSELLATIDELLDGNEDAKNELISIRSTPKRAAALAKKIKELESVKTKADGKGDDEKAKKAQEQIDKLVADFKAKESTYLSQIEAKEKEKLDTISNFKEELFFSGLKFATDFDLETNQLVAKQKIERALLEKGAKKIYNFTTGKFELKRADDLSLDYLDERNNKSSFEDFAKGVLTQNKLLAVSDSQRDISQKVPLLQHQTDSSGIKIDTSAFDKSVDEAISYQN